MLVCNNADSSNQNLIDWDLKKSIFFIIIILFKFFGCISVDGKHLQCVGK